MTCSAGSYSAGGASKCTSCPKGKYQTQAGQSKCITCPTRVSIRNRALSCLECDAGSYSCTTSSCCPVRPAVRRLPGTAVCTKCPGGAVSKAGAEGCGTCDRQHSSGSGSAQCIDCLKGEYSGSGAAQCAKCSAGSTRIKLVKPPANCVIRVLTRASWVLSRVASVQRALSVLKRARTSVQPARKAPMLRLPVHRSAPNARLVNSRPPLGKLLANCAPLVLTRTLLGNQSVLYAPRGPSPSTLEIHNALTAHQAQPMMW